jgi:hypothetical protein
MTKGQMPIIRIETLMAPRFYTLAQFQRAHMIATVCDARVFVLTAPPEHA